MLAGKQIRFSELALQATVIELSPCVVRGTCDGVDFVMTCTDEKVEAFTRNSSSVDFSEVSGNAHQGFEFKETRNAGLSLEQYIKRFGENYREFKKARQDFVMRLDALGISHDAENAIGWAEYSEFDNSYIDFLQRQIELNARGGEWTQLLTRRKAVLQQFVDVVMLKGTLHLCGTNIDYWFDETGAVVHHEEY